MFNDNFRSQRHSIKHLSNIFIVQSHTASSPITLRAVSVNVYLTAQGGILRRSGLLANGLQYLTVLSSIDNPVAKTTFRIFRIWDSLTLTTSKTRSYRFS